MSEFDRPLIGYRLVDTLYGDTLQRVAARELGNADRWPDLANINNLLPPYITDDASLASDRVVLSGKQIVVPAQSKISEASDSTDPDEIYQLDMGLIDGDLSADEGGDFVIFDGRANLKQALEHRVDVERGELLWHPEYGSLHRALIGTVNGPTAATLAAKYVAATLKADPRVQEVTSVVANVVGDQIQGTADVLPIIGRSMKIEVGI
jgi:phage baseplate assembly protein W